MIDNRDIGREIERVVAGLFGLALLAGVCIRLWRWYSGIWYKSVWSAIAGQPMLRSRVRWEYGLWEICPEGQLAALAVIVIIAALILGAIFNCRRFYWLAGGVFASGYLVNAYFMIKLMAAY